MEFNHMRTPSLRRLALASGMIISALAGPAASASDLPSYIIGSKTLPERPPIQYDVDFIARFDHRIVVDNGGSGPTADDVIAGHGSLWDKASAAIGRFDANTRLTQSLEDGDRRLLFVTYTFGEGQDTIVILGTGVYTGMHGLLNKQATNTFSIVGGTGRFLAAGGQCGITRLDEINYNVTCTAFVPDY